MNRTSSAEGPLLAAIDALAACQPQRVITVRLPAGCHRQLIVAAQAAQRSLNRYCLERLLGGHEAALVAQAAALDARPAIDQSPSEARS